MNRLVLGAVSALLLAAAGLFWWQGKASVEAAAPPPPPIKAERPPIKAGRPSATSSVALPLVLPCKFLRVRRIDLSIPGPNWNLEG